MNQWVEKSVGLPFSFFFWLSAFQINNPAEKKFNTIKFKGKLEEYMTESIEMLCMTYKGLQKVCGKMELKDKVILVQHLLKPTHRFS